jgi:hypothetical protein
LTMQLRGSERRLPARGTAADGGRAALVSLQARGSTGSAQP